MVVYSIAWPYGLWPVDMANGGTWSTDDDARDPLPWLRVSNGCLQYRTLRGLMG